MGIGSYSTILTKSQKYVIFAVTFGTVLECYELYLYVFWAPVIALLFFNQSATSFNLFNSIAIFSLGFVIRPLGGLFFGRYGDRMGRKKSFILSILMMSIPSFLLGILPVYAQIGIWAPIILGLIRVLQTFPSGGELPGAFCFLYENAPLARRKFMTSFAGVGNLIGIGLSAAECYLLEKYLPYEFFIEWGWRISFILGGFLGCAGFYLRYRLHETPLFQEIVHHHRMHRSSIATVVKANWGKLIQAMGFGASQTVAFHVISILFPVYLYRSMGFSFFEILVLLIVSLAGMALLLPLFGKLADRIGCKEIVFYASILMLLLICPMYVAIHSTSTMFVLGILTPFVLCIASITALWPFLVADLFSTSIRYTCIGLSFNISDGVFGGIATVLTLYLLEKTGDPGVFVWILLFGSLVSLVSFNRIKEPR